MFRDMFFSQVTAAWWAKMPLVDSWPGSFSELSGHRAQGGPGHSFSTRGLASEQRWCSLEPRTEVMMKMMYPAVSHQMFRGCTIPILCYNMGLWAIGLTLGVCLKSRQAQPSPSWPCAWFASFTQLKSIQMSTTKFLVDLVGWYAKSLIILGNPYKTVFFWCSCRFQSSLAC